MSFDFSSLKWGRIVIGVIVGFLIAMVVNLALQSVMASCWASRCVGRRLRR